MTCYQCTTCARIYGERPKKGVCTAVGFGNVERCGGLLVEAPDVYPRTQLQELGAQMFRESIERSVPADKSERANYWTQPITSEDIADIKEYVAEELAKIPDGRLFDAQGNLNNVTHEQVSRQLRQLRVTHETHRPNHHIQQAHAEVLKDLLDYNALDKARTKYINDLRAQHDLDFITSREFDAPRWKDEADMPEHYNDMIKSAIDLHADQPFEPPYEPLTTEAAQRMQDRWAEHYPETAAWHKDATTPTKKEWSAPTMTKIKSIADRWVAQLNWIKQFYEVIDILTELQCPPPIDRDPRKPDLTTFGPYPTSAVGGAHLSWSHKGKQIAFVTQSSHPTKRSYGFRVGDRKWHSVTDPRQLRDACEEFVSDLNRYLAEIS